MRREEIPIQILGVKVKLSPNDNYVLFMPLSFLLPFLAFLGLIIPCVRISSFVVLPTSLVDRKIYVLQLF